MNPTEAPEPLTPLRPWLRHKNWCNVKTDDPPDTERCKCGLAAALRAATPDPVALRWIRANQPSGYVPGMVYGTGGNYIDPSHLYAPAADPRSPFEDLEAENASLRAELAALRAATLPVAAVTGALLHRAWLKSGRRDPLLDADAWDGFALTVQAVAQMEGITTGSCADCGDACATPEAPCFHGCHR